MKTTMLGRALAASLLLATSVAAHASSIPSGGGTTISATNCAAGQAVNGISSAGAVTGCFAPPVAQDAFFSPYILNGGGALSGTTTFTYTLPSTTNGRLRFIAVGNGGPGGSGGLNNSVVRTGGGGGGPGGRRQWEVSIAELLASYPSTTALTVQFQPLGTPGPAQSTSATAGTAGSQSGAVYVKTNSSGTPIYATIGGGGGGGAGAAAATAAGGGGAGGSGQPSGAASASAGGNQTTAAADALIGPTGGGSGGGVTAANADGYGGLSGNALENIYSTKAGTSAPIQTNGAAASSPYYGGSCVGGVGGGAGGGSASTTVAAGSGAAGSGYGAGGGGGGAGTNGSSSGAGGPGSYGCVEIVWLPY